MTPTINDWSAVLGFLTGFANAIMNIWSSVITFVTTSGNEIALIGVFAFLFVLGVKGIRSLITGV